MNSGDRAGSRRTSKVLGHTQPSAAAPCRVAIEALEQRQLLAAPVVDPIDDVQVLYGRTMVLPVTASDVDGDKLAWSVKSSNRAFSATLLKGNPYLRITVENFGEMTFELFADVAPRTVEVISGMVQAGYYDGLTFHRVIPDFMIQGGDPAGDGSGGPDYEFDDEFHPSLVFGGAGQLAMAKAYDDGNGSQFFITTSSPRYLDFNHTIFGQLVRGMDVVEAISAMATDEDDAPLTPVRILSAELIENTTDAVIAVQARAMGSATITVTATDAAGNKDVRTFAAQTTTDENDDTPPFLGPIPDRLTPMNKPIAITVPVMDVEGDEYFVSAYFEEGSEDVGGDIYGNTIVIMPTNDFVGRVRVTVGVSKYAAAVITNPDHTPYFDMQTFTIGVGEKPIKGKMLPIGAAAGQPVDIQVANFTDADKLGTAEEYTASIYWGDGTSAADATVVKDARGIFTISGTHTYARAGEYPVIVEVVGDDGATLELRGKASVAALDAGADIVMDEGSALTRTGSLGTFNRDWRLTVDYGDGKRPGKLKLNADGTFQLTRTYDDDGDVTIEVRAVHRSGLAITDTILLTVENVGPATTLTGDATGLMDQHRRINLRATDPSRADSKAQFTYLIDWGDGSPVQEAPLKTRQVAHAFAEPGVYNVVISAVDKDGGIGEPEIHAVTILPAALETGPINPKSKSLRVVGTDGNDVIRLLPAGRGKVQVLVNEADIGVFKVNGRVQVLGLEGDDDIAADPLLGISAELLGGPGNDILAGGMAGDVLVGGDGNDTIACGAGRNLLIGGNGADALDGGEDDDLLIAGPTNHDGDTAALARILAEWSNPRTAYALRLSHLQGEPGGLNGAATLDPITIFNDVDADILTGHGGDDAFFRNDDNDTIVDAVLSETIVNA